MAVNNSENAWQYLCIIYTNCQVVFARRWTNLSMQQIQANVGVMEESAQQTTHDARGLRYTSAEAFNGGGCLRLSTTADSRKDTHRSAFHWHLKCCADYGGTSEKELRPYLNPAFMCDWAHSNRTVQPKFGAVQEAECAVQSDNV